MGSWEPIGSIALLQVQTEEMTGRGGYDLDMLVDVDSLLLTPVGVFGRSAGA